MKALKIEFKLTPEKGVEQTTEIIDLIPHTNIYWIKEGVSFIYQEDFGKITKKTGKFCNNSMAYFTRDLIEESEFVLIGYCAVDDQKFKEKLKSEFKCRINQVINDYERLKESIKKITICYRI